MRFQVAFPSGRRSSVALLLATVAFAACAGSSAPSATPAQEEKPNASIVNATTVVGKCPDQAQMNAKEAQRSIQQLVEPCATVPGGRAHFSAVLLPGGRIELGSPEGNPADGVVPTCVLTHKLQHQVRLKSPCALDVQLEERKVPMSNGAREEASSGW
jgi:hypothetical protein